MTKAQKIINLTIGRPTEKIEAYVQERVETTDGKKSDGVKVDNWKKVNGKWVKTEINQTDSINSANEDTFDKLLDNFGTELQHVETAIERNHKRHLQNMRNEDSHGTIYNENGAIYSSIKTAQEEKAKLNEELNKLNNENKKPIGKPKKEKPKKEKEEKPIENE